MPLSLPYSVLDVFAEEPLQGNPLAVFHDGRGLTDAQMGALARETNLSETTFVLPSDDPEQDRREGVRVRIFTTEEELPFAGHPTLGTAAFLREHHPALLQADRVVLRLKVGPVEVRYPGEEAAGQPGVYGVMRQPDPQFGAEFSPGEVAGVLGLSPQDLLPGVRPQLVSTGNAFCVVALRTVALLEKLAIPQAEALPWLRSRGGRWFYCIAPTGDSAVWRARMQWGGGEDPATGSAAGPAIAWLVSKGLSPAEAWRELRQGVEMKRPSRLFVKASSKSGQICKVDVGGRTIPVATGRFLLP